MTTFFYGLVMPVIATLTSLFSLLLCKIILHLVRRTYWGLHVTPTISPVYSTGCDVVDSHVRERHEVNYTYLEMTPNVSGFQLVLSRAPRRGVLTILSHLIFIIFGPLDISRAS